MSSDDWQERMKRASENAEKKADAETKSQLDDIANEINQLKTIIRDLKLNDKQTYDKLVQAVAEATKRNESIAAIKGRLKTLGEVGMNLAGSLVSGGGLDALRRTLNV